MLQLTEDTRTYLRQHQRAAEGRERKRLNDATRPKLSRKLKHDRFNGLVDKTAGILKSGEPTLFAFEGACRQGLRAGLIFEGWRWIDADASATEVVHAALRLIGAERPRWIEGQPEHTQEGFAPIERTRCVRCGGWLPNSELNTGWEVKYCSQLCSVSARLHYEKWSGEKRTQAQYHAQLTAAGKQKRQARQRLCAICDAPFIPRENKETAIFCSNTCRITGQRIKSGKEKTCLHCGLTFQTDKRGDARKYCSQDCFQGSKIQRKVSRLVPLACEQCGSQFTPRHNGARFCGRSCRTTWINNERYGRHEPNDVKRQRIKCSAMQAPNASSRHLTLS